MKFINQTSQGVSVGDSVVFQIYGIHGENKIIAIIEDNNDDWLITEGGDGGVSAVSQTKIWKEFINSTFYSNQDSKDICIIHAKNSYIKHFILQPNKPINYISLKIDLSTKCACGKECKPTDNGECYDCWNKKHQWI